MFRKINKCLPLICYKIHCVGQENPLYLKRLYVKKDYHWKQFCVRVVMFL